MIDIVSNDDLFIRSFEDSGKKTNSSRDESENFDHINNQHHKDLVQYMAEEKDSDRRAITRRRIFWQVVIFMIAVTINLMIIFRERFILDKAELVPDSNLRFASNLCKGIGFIVIGNLYDNVIKPKKLTFLIILSLAFATALVSAQYVKRIGGNTFDERPRGSRGHQ